MMVIPQWYLDLFPRVRVHVEGWDFKCQFKYRGTSGGVHTIMTPQTKRHFHTRNRLLFTRQGEKDFLKQFAGSAAPEKQPPVGHEQGPRVKAKFSPLESNPQSASVMIRLSDSQSEGHCASGGLPLNTPSSALSQQEKVRVSG